MSKDYLGPFADAARQTLKLLLDVDALESSNQTESNGADNNEQVGVVIGLTGDLSGEVQYRFPSETSLEIVKLMSGMEFTEIDEFVTSALGEIANIISGNAVIDLSNHNVICDILPPKINEISAGAGSDETTYIFSTKLDSEIGVVDIKLQLKMN